MVVLTNLVFHFLIAFIWVVNGTFLSFGYASLDLCSILCTRCSSICSFLVILSVKDLSRWYASWYFWYFQLHAYRQNTTSYAPVHMSVLLGYSVDLFSAMHGSLVTSSLVAKPLKRVSELWLQVRSRRRNL